MIYSLVSWIYIFENHFTNSEMKTILIIIQQELCINCVVCFLQNISNVIRCMARWVKKNYHILSICSFVRLSIYLSTFIYTYRHSLSCHLCRYQLLQNNVEPLHQTYGFPFLWGHSSAPQKWRSHRRPYQISWMTS